jgi:hypothetical protein
LAPYLLYLHYDDTYKKAMLVYNNIMRMYNIKLNK